MPCFVILIPKHSFCNTVCVCMVMQIKLVVVVVAVFICQRAPAKLKCFFYRRLYSKNIDCFVRDSLRLDLTFCVLFVISKQQLKRCNYSADQAALLTGFRTEFTSSVWNFCSWVVDNPPRETSPAAKSEEKRMFSQATNSKLYAYNTSMRNSKFNVWDASRLFFPDFKEGKIIKKWSEGKQKLLRVIEGSSYRG